MKKLLAVLLSAVLLVGCSTEETPEATATPEATVAPEVTTTPEATTTPEEASNVTVEDVEGKALVTVTAEGFAGDIVVEFTFADATTIEAVNVVSHTETEGYGKDVIEAETFAPSVIDGTFDVVAGATVTSEALLQARENALVAANEFFAG